MELVQVGSYVAKIQKYRNGNLCVTVERNGEPWASLSVNTDCTPKEDEFILNHNCVGPMVRDMIAALLSSGHFVDTGKMAHYGFCCQPVWQYIP